MLNHGLVPMPLYQPTLLYFLHGIGLISATVTPMVKNPKLLVDIAFMLKTVISFRLVWRIAQNRAVLAGPVNFPAMDMTLAVTSTAIIESTMMITPYCRRTGKRRIRTSRPLVRQRRTARVINERLRIIEIPRSCPITVYIPWA